MKYDIFHKMIKMLKVGYIGDRICSSSNISTWPSTTLFCVVVACMTYFSHWTRRYTAAVVFFCCHKKVLFQGVVEAAKKKPLHLLKQLCLCSAFMHFFADVFLVYTHMAWLVWQTKNGLNYLGFSSKKISTHLIAFYFSSLLHLSWDVYSIGIYYLPKYSPRL